MRWYAPTLKRCTCAAHVRLNQRKILQVFKTSNCAHTLTRNPNVCCANHVRLNVRIFQASKNLRDGTSHESWMNWPMKCRLQSNTWDHWQDARFPILNAQDHNIKTKRQDWNFDGKNIYTKIDKFLKFLLWFRAMTTIFDMRIIGWLVWRCRPKGIKILDIWKLIMGWLVRR